MKRCTSILIGILFFVWILPLGAFIKPKDEKKTCNGKRAICLCSHLLAKQAAKNAGKQFLKSGSHVNQVNSGSSSLSPDYIHSTRSNHLNISRSQFVKSTVVFVISLFSRPIEHVPKA